MRDPRRRTLPTAISVAVALSGLTGGLAPDLGCSGTGAAGGLSGAPGAAGGTTGAGGTSGAASTSGMGASGTGSTAATGSAARGASDGGTTGSAGTDSGTRGAMPASDAGLDGATGQAPDAASVARADAAGMPDAGAVDGSPAAEGGSATCGGAVLGGGPTTTTTTHLDIGVHDPSMIWDGSRYYLFATGGTLGVRSSADILTWTSAGNVLAGVPTWITTALGSTPSDLWAPDISYFNGQFHVYYAGSRFGSNDSVIGLATSATLRSPTWVDQGLIVQSKTTDDFNAIDPNVSFDQNCAPWLAFGSFWSGIKLRKLDPATGKPATDDRTVYSLASRNGGAIEAASIIAHGGYYYLFVSFDLCCQGVSSTYRTMVGRATTITGPYVDKAGNGMLQGAAEPLLATSGRYIGPGGGTAWKDGSTYLYAYHYYDGNAGGASKLQVRPIAFAADNWVTLGAPLFP